MQESGNERCQGEHAKCLGSTIFEAKYYSDKTVSLTTIGKGIEEIESDEMIRKLVDSFCRRRSFESNTFVGLY